MDTQSVLIITGGILLGCLIGLSWFAGTDAPYVATKSVRIRKILETAGLKKGQIFWELGSGDGRVVLEAAKMGAKAYGIEQSWLRVLLSRWKARTLNGHPKGVNMKFIHGNVFSLSFWGLRRNVGGLQNLIRKRFWTSQNDIVKANIVFIFLLPKAVEKLEPLLKKNLKKGSKVITQTFHFKNWKPFKKVLITDKNIPNTPLGKNVVEGDFWIYRV